MRKFTFFSRLAAIVLTATLSVTTWAEPRVVQDNGQIISVEAEIGDVLTYNLPVMSDSQFDHWVSENTEVALPDQDGGLAFVGAGQTSVRVCFSGDTTLNYDFSVVVNGPAKDYMDIWFEEEAYEIPLKCASFESPRAFTSPDSLPIRYSIDYTEITDTVAEIDPLTGEITPLDTGMAVVRATFAGNDTLEENSVQYILHILEPPFREGSLAFDMDTVYALYNEPFEALPLGNPYDLDIMWSSQYDSIASIDSLGNITINGIGETTIYATTHGNECYGQAHAEYQLVVAEPFIGLRVFGIEVTRENASAIWGEQVKYDIDSRTLTFDNVHLNLQQLPDLEGPIVEDIGEVNGELNIVFNGRCEFTETPMGIMSSTGVNITGDTLILAGRYAQIWADVVKIDGIYVDLTNSDEEVCLRADSLIITNNAHLIARNTNDSTGAAAVANILNFDDNIAILSDGVWFYQDPEFSGSGFYTDGDHTVAAKEVEIGVMSIPSMLFVLGTEVTEENADDILGNGKVYYDFETAVLTLDNLKMDLAAYDRHVYQFIESMNEIEGLNINVKGQCEITNSEYGIFSVMRITITGDTLILSGGGQQIHADALIIDGADVTATADSLYAVYTQELTLSNNAHLAAKCTSENGAAAHTYYMELDDNLALLTAGVQFVPVENFDFDAPHGFFIDSDHSVEAKEIEIGKTAVVIEEETTIDFSTVNEDGNEDIVLSLGVDDKINEQGQLEITTTLTEEQVDEALETLVPGSSDYKNLLPGSITFDVPAGKGEIRIECKTLMGYTLQVKIAGQAAIRVEQTTFGWATVTYDVEQDTHVVIYLKEPEVTPSSAPARAKADGEPTVGAQIKSLKIVPIEKAKEGLITVDEQQQTNSKIFFNGQLYILRGDKVYTATGAEIK